MAISNTSSGTAIQYSWQNVSTLPALSSAPVKLDLNSDGVVDLTFTYVGQNIWSLQTGTGWTAAWQFVGSSSNIFTWSTLSSSPITSVPGSLYWSTFPDPDTNSAVDTNITWAKNSTGTWAVIVDGLSNATNVYYQKVAASSNHSPTGAVTITGTATNGQTLTATNSLADADGLGTIAYTWKANGTNIGTGATYTLTQSEVGKSITVTASYIDILGTLESINSSSTSSVVNVNRSPTGAVTITGTATQGQTLTATNSLADADGLGTIAYTWKANGTTVGTGATYTLTQSEVGKTITATASYTDLGGTAESVASSATSSVANVNDLPTGVVSISGTATQGQTLTATNSLADADGLGTIAYTWKANGTNIGTGATYTLTQSEVGKTITATASYTDLGGTAESVASSATSSVAGTNSSPYGTVNISGLIVQGSTLTATSSIVDPSGLYKNVTYKWLSTVDGITWSTIGAGNNFALSSAQNYLQIEAVATYTNGLGASIDIKSTPTFSVLPSSVTKSVSNGAVSAGITGSGISLGVSLVQLSNGDLIGFGYLNDSNAPAGANTYGNYSKFLIADFNSNGVLNSSFGNQGFGLWDFGGGLNFAKNFYPQSDGKFVIAGGVGTYSNAQFGIARYNPDGTLDTSFGTNGETVTSFSSIYGGTCYASTRQSDGKYILVGRVQSPQNYGEAVTVRYNTDGTIDKTFGTNGVAITDVGSNIPGITFSMQQSDGKILEVGSLQVSSGATFKGYTEILRYNTNGTLDTTFGSNGIVQSNYTGYYEQGFSAVQQANGKLIVLSNGYIYGNANPYIYLSRYNLNGSLDTTFGNSGVITISNSTLTGYLVNGSLGGCQLIQQFDGKLVLAVGESGYTGGINSNNLAMVRFNSDGTYDNSFGSAGRISINTTGSYYPSSIIQESNGQLVVSGSGSSGNSSYLNLLRINSDGSIDSTFGSSVNHSATGAVTITGTATQGQTLTATNSLADADGLGTIAYTWKANGSTVGTGSSYTLTQSEVGKTITATASYTDLGGTAESVASSATSSVANVNDLPTGAVTITGSAKQGQTLTATNTLADVDGLAAISYTWKANGTTIATGTTYTLTQAELGKTITATASYTDLLGTPESVTSVATGVVFSLPQVGVSVSPASVNESGSTNLLYTFTRTGDSSSSLTVNLNVTGTAGTSDYISVLNLTDTKPWTKLLGTGSWDIGTALTAGTDGSIYVSGVTYSSLDGQTFSGGNGDAFIAKYLSDGTKSWTKLLGSNSDDGSYALTTGVDGSIYTSGCTTGNLDGQANNGGYDAFITKYLPDGTKSWTRLLGTSSTDQAYAMAKGADGAIYVSGFTNGNLDGQINSGSSDVFLAKYLPDGTKSWTKLIGGSSYEWSFGLTTGADGSIYVSGTTQGSNFDGQINSGGNDAFIAKYLPDGTKSWTRLLGSSADDWAFGSATGADGAIYISGYTNGNLDGQTNSGGNDAFIAKYLPDGTKSWTRLLGSSADDLAYGLTTGTDGSIYVSGVTYSSLDGQTFSGSSDVFIAKYSPDGTKSWTKLLGTSSDDAATSLATGTNGAIYISGYTYGNLDGQTNSGGNDAFITKIASNPQVTFSAGSSTATLVIDPTPDLIVEGNETVVVSVAQGTGYDLGATSTATGTIVDTIRFLGGSGTDTFIGNHVTDTRNNFIGAGGNDDITGDSRADVAEYSGNLSDYNISASNGLITITDSRAGSSYDGTDTLHGINLLKFADGMEFVGLAAQRVALTGSEVNHTVQVTENKLYSGTNAAEKFVIASNVSSMILAGEGDTVHLAGSFTDYIYASRGSELQITKGDFMTTVNLAGNVSIETDLGHVNAKLDFTQATPRVMLDTQLVTAGSIDATLLNTHATYAVL